jgi:Flp pilus assembly protein TadG
VTEGKGVRTVRHFRHARGDEGAAAVEFALLFPIFMILALGIIYGGFAFSRQINITQAAREASRFGSSYDIAGINGGSGTLTSREDTWLSAVDTAVTQAAGNRLNPIGGYDYRCVAIVRMNAGGTAVDTSVSRYREVNGTAAATSGSGACPSTSAAAVPGGTYAQVVLSRDAKFFVLFISPTLQLDAVSVTPYEGKLT